MREEIKTRIEAVRRGEVPEGYHHTKDIGLAPVDWRIGKLSDVIHNEVRSVPKPNDAYWRLGIRSWAKGTFHSYVDDPSTVDMDELYVVRENDLIVNITFAWEHAIAIASKDDDGLLVSHRFPTYVFDNGNSPKYYGAVISQRYFKDMLEHISPGGAGRNRVLNRNDFLNLPCYIPPLAEQQKIAEILSTCDRVIELKQQLLDEKRKQKQWLMQMLLDPDSGVRLPGFEGSEWYTVTLGEYCDCLDTLRKPVNAQQREKMQGDYPYWGANSIQGYVSEYIFDEEIVLLAEDGGSFDDFKTKPIAVFVNEKCWVNNHAHILRAKNGNTKLLYFLLVHKDIRNYINGTTRSKLTQSDMLAIPIVLPKDNEEQKQIIKVLSVCESELDLIEQELEAWQQKKKALMQLLLTGLVRVNA